MMNEIWVPTQFHYETFAASGVNRSKLVVIPESVDIDTFNPETTQPLNHLPGYPETREYFKFLSIFKWEPRKVRRSFHHNGMLFVLNCLTRLFPSSFYLDQGWDVLLRAYFEEFTRNDKVVLYLLTNAFHPEKGELFCCC